MKNLLIAVCLLFTNYCFAQNIYEIRADTVRIYNTCDTSELVLENHTQDTLGFLYNKGKGRTEFRRLQLEKVGASQLAITGQDTVSLSPISIVTTSTMLDDTYHTVVCNNSSGCGGASGPLLIITLPSASGILGREYNVKRNAAGCVGVMSAGGTIEGGTNPSRTYFMNSSAGNDWATFISDGTNWKVINRSYVIPNTPTPSLADVTAVGSVTSTGLTITDANSVQYIKGLNIAYASAVSQGWIIARSSKLNNDYVRLNMFNGESVQPGYARADLEANDSVYGHGRLIIHGSKGSTEPVGEFEGAVKATGLILNSRLVAESTTANTEDYTLINVASIGNPTITLTGGPGTIYVLVEEAFNPIANGMNWAPAIRYKGADYSNANNVALGSYSRFTVQNVNGTWYLIGAN